MLVPKSCLTLCDPTDCSPPGSSVHGILQARILEWVAISYSRGSTQPRDPTRVSCIASRVFTIWVTWGSPAYADVSNQKVICNSPASGSKRRKGNLSGLNNLLRLKLHEANTIHNAWDLHPPTHWKAEQRRAETLTFLEGREEHLEAAVAAALVGPHADDPEPRAEHHVVGHSAAELGFQVLHRAASVIHRHEVPLAFVGILHLIVQEP